jgi:hypothetical protein
MELCYTINNHFNHLEMQSIRKVMIRVLQTLMSLEIYIIVNLEPVRLVEVRASWHEYSC